MQYTETQTAVNATPAPTKCPVDHRQLGLQKSARELPATAPFTTDSDGVWHIHGYTQARDILRGGQTKQAGFRAEQLEQMPTYLKPPVLFLEGQTHQQMRRQTAVFFTPKTTRQNYYQLMEELTAQIIAELQQKGRADLSDLSLKMAVTIAAQVVGLTNSRLPGLSNRIEAFFTSNADAETGWTPHKFYNFLRGQWTLTKFLLLDVQPAIQARKKQRQEDVISHLLDKDYGNIEILTECLTYGSAGMVTTREFISMAFWHLMEQPELKERYLVADEDERQQILGEILRLEPIVGNLMRRAVEPIPLESGETIPAGTLLNLHLYDVNADETVVGDAPRLLRPEREMTPMRPKVPAHAMSFGDGHHRCPGAHIALQETDIFLNQLLRLPNLRIIQPPTIGYQDAVKGYELRNFIIAVD